MRAFLIVGILPLAISAKAADTAHAPGSAATEAYRQPLNWLSVAQGIDAERSQTLRVWETRYAHDRGTALQPYVPMRSLSTMRHLDISGVDACLAREGERELSFAQVLERNLDIGFESRKIATNSVIDSPSAYNLSADRVPVGWLSHPFCTFDSKNILGELSHSLESRVVPDEGLARELNNYLLFSNFLRNKVLASTSALSVRQNSADYKAYQGILMSCLGYTESLSGSESSEGDQIYANLNRKAYVAKSTRPEGVSMGVDRPADYFVGNRSRREQVALGLPEEMATYKDVMGRAKPQYFKYSDDVKAKLAAATSDSDKQRIKQNFVASQVAAVRAARSRGESEDSIHKNYFSDISDSYWVSAGVYQFKFGNLDTANGDVMDSNIGPCVDQWNELFGNRCPIAHTVAGYAAALSSPGQAFNMFCGTQKLLQSFNVQIHTQNPSMTASQNMNADGTLKAPADRCVHPFWKGGRGYNHFGPLANSAPRGSISSLKSFPGNLAILNECIHKNGARVFGGAR